MKFLLSFIISYKFFHNAHSLYLKISHSYLLHIVALRILLFFLHLRESPLHSCQVFLLRTCVLSPPKRPRLIEKRQQKCEKGNPIIITYGGALIMITGGPITVRTCEIFQRFLFIYFGINISTVLCFRSLKKGKTALTLQWKR